MEPIKEVAEITVAYHPKKNIEAAPMITSSGDAAICLLEGFNHDTLALQEQFIVAYLSRANRLIGLFKASNGSMTGTIADPRLILAVGLKVAAVSMILAHNHPSGNLKPSKADEDLTRKIREAGKFMDITVLDHLILSPDGTYYSMADEGVL